MNPTDFALEELTANRSGRLTMRQQEQIDAYLILARKRSRFALIAGTGSVALLFGIAFLSEPDGFRPALPYLTIAAAFYLAIFLGFMVLDFNKLRHLNTREIRSVDGIAQTATKTFRHGRWTAYYVTVENIRFQIGRDQFEAFQNGRRYCVHFISYPPTHWMLSAEQK